MEIIESNEGKFKISSNKVFLLKLPEPNRIFIKNDNIEKVKLQNPGFFKYLKPINLRSTRNKENSITQKYTEFEVLKDFDIKGKKNDCLLFAERVSLNDPNYSQKSCVFKVESDKQKRRFGQNDKTNSAIVSYTRNYYMKKQPNHNVEVNPDIGDAYAMVPYKIQIDKGVCPYHAATVIFKDGTTNITIEADAGVKTTKGIFDMYSTIDHSKTFYRTHMPTYIYSEKRVTSTSRPVVKLPTVLHLKQDYKPTIIKEKIKEKDIEIKPLRRSSRFVKESPPKSSPKSPPKSPQKSPPKSPQKSPQKNLTRKKSKKNVKKTRNHKKNRFKGR